MGIGIITKGSVNASVYDDLSGRIDGIVAIYALDVKGIFYAGISGQVEEDIGVFVGFRKEIPARLVGIELC